MAHARQRIDAPVFYWRMLAAAEGALHRTHRLHVELTCEFRIQEKLGARDLAIADLRRAAALDPIAALRFET